MSKAIRIPALVSNVNGENTVLATSAGTSNRNRSRSGKFEYSFAPGRYLTRSWSGEHIRSLGENAKGRVTVIQVRPFRNSWKVFEAPGVEPVFLNQEDATDYAKSLACFRSVEIRILD